jgi:hypothetical protein
MINSIQTVEAENRGSPSRWLGRVAGVVLLACAMNVVAQAPAGTGGAAPPQSAEALDTLVGPIALYPDDLVAIILPASTNPLQLVQADRYLDKRKADPKLPVDEKWDDAVKSLLNYPDVVKSMSADLDWTSALGEAVVTDQGAVLDAIQSFRRRAQAAGNLKSDDKQVVQVEQEIVTIVPADPQVIYVPQYNPSTVVVYGTAPYWGYYPTPYPSYYYPYAPGAALAAGVIWGAAIGAAWNGGHYVSHYGGDANININRNTNINTGNINRGNAAAGGGTAWKSNKQPGQVSSSVGKTASSARVGDARAGGGGAAGYAGGGAARASAQPAGGGMGASASARGAASASASPRDSYGGGANRGGGGGDAFGGYGSGSGRQTQMDSSRGASSRSSMSGGGSRGGGGGGRGGGGGGRGGGGRR